MSFINGFRRLSSYITLFLTYRAAYRLAISIFYEPVWSTVNVLSQYGTQWNVTFR